MGVCPQFDILYDDLTVEEHLELFGVFKGCNRDAMQEDIKKLILELGLLEKQEVLYQML